MSNSISATFLLSMVGGVVLSVTTGSASVLYVDDSSTNGLNNGTSWSDAFTDLQDALDVASNGTQIWVAQGSYAPAGPGGPRTATFHLVNGVQLYGGFDGTEAGLEERDVAGNVSILSGDLAGDDVGTNGRNENSYNVVTGGGCDETAVLDGFTITCGNANGGYPIDRGGGMYNPAGSPTVANCTFTANSAYYGGGMHNREGSNPTVTSCAFTGNWTTSSVGLGGAMFNGYDSSPTVTDCVFTGNSAYRGGGMYNYDNCNPTTTHCAFIGNPADRNGGGISNRVHSNAVVIRCTFSGNSSELGGGIYNNFSDPTVINCIFSGNAADEGGGIYSRDDSDPMVTNCTFSANTADSGGGIFCRVGLTTVTNGIVWGNTGGQIYGPTIVTFSDVQGGWNGTGNITADPLLVDFDGPDDVPGTADDDLHLLPNSPCVNVGDNSAAGLPETDFEGDTRIQQCRVDMGADETPFFDDCDSNGTADACDMADCPPGEPSCVDCDENGTPDGCDIAGCPPQEPSCMDCNTNGVPDGCEPDCNTNSVADECDITAGTSADVNLNGIPDECEPCVTLPGTGDANANEHLDLDDFAVFVACLTGPGAEVEAGCEVMDMDGDCNVDLADFAKFQQSFGTP